jgi:predicted ATP-grasp superfamily ATP-dependent carboligase
LLASLGEDDVAARSRYVRASVAVPGFDPPDVDRSAEILLDLGARIARALGRRAPLFCMSDKHLDMIYARRSEFTRAFAMILNDEETAWALHDKGRFYDLCERRGVRAPRTLQSSADIDARLHELGEPLLVKPKQKTAWREIQGGLLGGAGKARVFATRADLCEEPGFARYKDRIIVQEYIASDVMGLLSFHGLADASGVLLAHYCGRKIRTQPMFAGESSFIELVRGSELEAEGKAVAAKLGLRGPFKIDFVRNRASGELVVLEINARYNLWNRIGAAHGVNLPAIAYDLLVNGRAPAMTPAYEPAYRWLDLYRDYHAFREERTRGGMTAAGWIASVCRPRTLYGTFAWNDPMPFVHWMAEFVANRTSF